MVTVAVDSRVSECERVAGALLALRGEPKVSGKAAVLDEYAGDGAVRRVLRFLADENKVTGLSTKKLARTVPPVSHDMGVVDLAEYLCEHNNGGDREVGMVLFFLSLIGDERGRDVAAQVLAKKWPLTVGASLLNRVYGPGFVPEFNAQLAFPWEKKISAYGDDAVFIVTQKLDGVRALIEVDRGCVVAVRSRKGKPIRGLVEVEAAAAAVVPSEWGRVMLDGELIADGCESMTTGEGFRATSSIVRSGGDKSGVSFHVFDVVPATVFDDGTGNKTYRERRRMVDALPDEGRVRKVPVLGEATISDIGGWGEYAHSRGWEGVMLNNPDGVYERKRTSALLKVKRMKTADLPIVGFEEAIDGENKGGLRSLTLALGDGGDTVNVSSGLTDEEKREIWGSRDAYVGRMVEVRFFEETSNSVGGRSLRFPAFVGFRDDKTADDANVE